MSQKPTNQTNLGMLQCCPKTIAIFLEFFEKCDILGYFDHYCLYSGLSLSCFWPVQCEGAVYVCTKYVFEVDILIKNIL